MAMMHDLVPRRGEEENIATRTLVLMGCKRSLRRYPRESLFETVCKVLRQSPCGRGSNGHGSSKRYLYPNNHL